MKILFLTVFFFFLFIPISLAQKLNPGESDDFFVLPIVLEDVECDYKGKETIKFSQNKKLCVSGDEGFLNIRWKTLDPGGIEREVGVECYLNCENPGDNLENCAEYQSCSFLGFTGERSCTILNPEVIYDKINIVICKFYDPRVPEISLKENRTFKVVDFSVSASQPSVTVGKEFILPINIKNFGLFSTRFEVNISPLRQEYFVIMERGRSSTLKIDYGEVARVFPKIEFLASNKIPFTILSRAAVDKKTCIRDADCNYLSSNFPAKCLENVCWNRLDIEIESGKASLPSLTLKEFLFILILSPFLFLLYRVRSLKEGRQ